MKQKTDILCPFCGSDKIIKHGKSRNGVQRYKCKNNACKRTFLEKKKRTKYTSKEKALLSLLKNFLEPSDKSNLTIKDAIRNIDESTIDVSKFNLVQRSVSNSNEVQCYGPKILICQEFDTVTIYRFNNRVHGSSSRTIAIVDDDENSKFKKTMKLKLEKDKKNFKPKPHQKPLVTEEELFMFELENFSYDSTYDDPHDYY